MWPAHKGSKATEPTRECSQMCLQQCYRCVCPRGQRAEKAAQFTKCKEQLANTAPLNACLYGSWAKDQPDVF